MVFYLARYLANENYKVVVITRGYRGTGSDKAQVVSDGEKILTLSETAGDEAYMLAKKLSGIPVLVGKDRVAAGKMAVEHFDAQIAILDDGFQYHRLKRDLDIVLINARNPFGNGFLLPRGTLREPLTALQRTPMILLTKIDASSDNIKELEDQIRSYNDQTCIFTSFFQPISLKKAHSAQETPLNSVRGKKVIGFCSIGDPDSFFGILNRLRVVLVQKIIFPDHHRYQKADYQLITQWAEEAEYIITTEKDVAKIDVDMIQKKKLFVMQIEPVIDNEEIFTRRIKEFTGIF
jgi:tetraacyldisaccharide 4'-kinase